MLNDSKPNGHNSHRDDGIARETRRRPCSGRKAWCVLELDHEGDCIEIGRGQDKQR